MIDIHAHILPGLDDGPKDISESIEMCMLSKADGVTTIVATPHMNDGMYNVTREQALDAVSKVQVALDNAGTSMRILAGGDIHISSDLLEKLKEKEIITLGDDGKYIMLELPSDVIPHRLLDFLFSVQVDGLTPIISHLERNFAVQEKPEIAEKLVKAGNLVQLTAASVVGDFGSKAKKCSHILLKRRLAHFVATDMHSLKKRPPGRLSKARQIVGEIMSEKEAEDIFTNWPEKVLAGDYIDTPDPLEWRNSEKKGLLAWLR